MILKLLNHASTAFEYSVVERAIKCLWGDWVKGLLWVLRGSLSFSWSLEAVTVRPFTYNTISWPPGLYLHSCGSNNDYAWECPPQSLCSRFLIIPWGKASYMDYIAEHIRSMRLELKFLESDMLVYLMLISRQQLWICPRISMWKAWQT